MKNRGWIAFACIAVLAGGIMCIRAYNQNKNPTAAEEYEQIEEVEYPEISSELSYYDYLQNYADAGRPDTVISISGNSFLSQNGAEAEVKAYEGMENILYWDSQEGSVTWEFEVENEGLYNLAIHYSPIKVKGNELQLGIMLDGVFPYANAETITLPRLFLDETYHSINDNAFKQDTAGNETRPVLKELSDWQIHTVTDGDGQYTGALSFYLSKGIHTITLTMQAEGAAIQSLEFYQEPELPDYETVKADWDAKGVKDTSGYELIYQAEKSYLKSDNILFPTYDRSSVSIQPSDPHKIRYNTIGKNTWDKSGQYISWEIEAPEDGYYQIAFKVKQNEKRGMYSVRRLEVDGSPLFSEMEIVKFPFENSWYINVFGDKSGTPYKIYLTKGTHVIGMEVTVGDVSDVLRRVDKSVEALNYWYREIVKITGSNADAERITIDYNRDFLLDQKIPGLLAGFAEIQKDLEGVLEDLRKIDGIELTSASIVSETIELMKSYIKKPGKIANRIETYRGNMSSLASWTIEMRSQPLEMDYFVLYSPDMAKPKIGTNFFKQIGYRFTMFLDSFVTDYNSLGDSEGDPQKALTVWVSTADMNVSGGVASGRDQAMLLKRLIDDVFTPETGIHVQVSLVNSSSTLTQAVLANKGPDVALFVTKDTPVNLAMRGALLELSAFEDFDKVISQFMPSAMIPYEYRGKYYAFPETQSFDMLFYRTDIFDDLGLTPPKTWEDFYEIVPTLMEENFIVGIPETQRTFEMLLYQYGGRFYNEERTQTAFDTPEALKAFEDWTDLYVKYSVPLVFDFFNRFRTGEMPMAIMPYTQVNYISAAAPELKNLWDIAPVPATVREDGTLNHAETANGTASIILKDTKQPAEAFEFLKWWVSADTQSRFGIELEQNLGPAARYPTANVAAFETLPWSKEQSKSLMQQWESVTDVPQIPGSYYISRNISFAFRAVAYRDKFKGSTYKFKNVRETLYKYNKEINKEITRKLKEFEFSD